MDITNLRTFGHTFLEINELALRNNCRCNLSMITFTFNLDDDNVDIIEFAAKFKMHNVCLKPSKQRSQTSSVKNDFFFNQITLEYQTTSKKSIKIFKNGKVHVTGLSSLYECYHVASLVCEWLKMIFFKNFCVVKHSHKIDLINCTLDINTTLSFKAFIRVLAKFNLQYIYHPDIYCAIKVNFAHTKFMIFKSGSVILSSKDSILRVKHALSQFIIVINEYKRLHRTHQPPKLIDKFYRNPFEKDFDFCHGYPIKDLLAAQTEELD